MPEQATERVWKLDPLTLQEVLVDRKAALLQARNGTPMERIWALRLLGRLEEAADEGERLLAGSDNRFAPLLLLAHVYQCQYRWDDAARLQGEALTLARTPAREATVHHHTGRRLLEEGRYREAAEEFEWAWDLHRAAGSPEEVAQMSYSAMRLARRRSVEYAFSESDEQPSA